MDRAEARQICEDSSQDDVLIDIGDFEEDATAIRMWMEPEEVEKSTGVYFAVTYGHDIVVVERDGTMSVFRV